MREESYSFIWQPWVWMKTLDGIFVLTCLCSMCLLKRYYTCVFLKWAGATPSEFWQKW